MTDTENLEPAGSDEVPVKTRRARRAPESGSPRSRRTRTGATLGRPRRVARESAAPRTRAEKGATIGRPRRVARKPAGTAGDAEPSATGGRTRRIARQHAAPNVPSRTSDIVARTKRIASSLRNMVKTEDQDASPSSIPRRLAMKSVAEVPLRKGRLRKVKVATAAKPKRRAMKAVKPVARNKVRSTVMRRIKIEGTHVAPFPGATDNGNETAAQKGKKKLSESRRRRIGVKEELDACDSDEAPFVRKRRKYTRRMKGKLGIKREDGAGPMKKRRMKLVMVMKAKKPQRKVDDEDDSDSGDDGAGSTTSKRRRPYVACNVLNCTKAAHWRREAPDQFADAGMRCRRHHLYCEVIGCTNVTHVVKTANDIFGFAGRRCRGHAHSCNISGCRNVAGAKKMQKDSLGPAGWRCPRHAYFCSVVGCTNVGQVIKVSEPNTSAELVAVDTNSTTRLCMRHAYICNISGCKNVVKRKKKDPDVFGPSGWRCERHNHPCTVEGCTNGGRVKKQSDHFGPAGWRCKRHGHMCQVLEPVDENEDRGELDQFGNVKPRDMTKMRQCPNVAHVLKKGDDSFGPPGYRCQKHSYNCNVPNCPNVPLVLKQVGDAFGVAGWRCKQHGHFCNVSGCTHMAHVLEKNSDHFGSGGKRCKRHSSRYLCGVTSCARLARVIVRKDDVLGKAGKRCGEHAHACNVACCATPGMHRVGNNEAASKRDAAAQPQDVNTTAKGKGRKGKKNQQKAIDVENLPVQPNQGLPLEPEDSGIWYCPEHYDPEDTGDKKGKGTQLRSTTGDSANPSVKEQGNNEDDAPARSSSMPSSVKIELEEDNEMSFVTYLANINAMKAARRGRASERTGIQAPLTRRSMKVEPLGERRKRVRTKEENADGQDAALAPPRKRAKRTAGTTTGATRAPRGRPLGSTRARVTVKRDPGTIAVTGKKAAVGTKTVRKVAAKRVRGVVRVKENLDPENVGNKKGDKAPRASRGTAKPKRSSARGATETIDDAEAGTSRRKVKTERISRVRGAPVKVKPCNVDGCNRASFLKQKESDEYGASGRRCQMHVHICNVVNCVYVGVEQRPADAKGASGWRCAAHA
eukprot:GEMP01001437.1.p1 GENE.GEMP01001437.1~~GEMP01001437.1.p1  ORF type:complete len:1084 (+),score=270.62 GEMP01001437.1:98-3349(+)